MSTEDRIQKALSFINDNGSFDGGHHKQWVLDQVVRILTGCPMVTEKANDYQGKPYEYEAQGESEEYQEWVRKHRDGEDGPETYNWDTGIAP